MKKEKKVSPLLDVCANGRIISNTFGGGGGGGSGSGGYMAAWAGVSRNSDFLFYRRRSIVLLYSYSRAARMHYDVRAGPGRAGLRAHHGTTTGQQDSTPETFSFTAD